MGNRGELLGGLNSFCDVTVELNQSAAVLRDVTHRRQRAERQEHTFNLISLGEPADTHTHTQLPVQGVGVAL